MKSVQPLRVILLGKSPSARMVWIEIRKHGCELLLCARHHPQGWCGLKFFGGFHQPDVFLSPSARMVWIEIASVHYEVALRNRHHPHGWCGLKCEFVHDKVDGNGQRPSRGVASMEIPYHPKQHEAEKAGGQPSLPTRFLCSHQKKSSKNVVLTIVYYSIKWYNLDSYMIFFRFC